MKPYTFLHHEQKKVFLLTDQSQNVRHLVIHTCTHKYTKTISVAKSSRLIGRDFILYSLSLDRFCYTINCGFLAYRAYMCVCVYVLEYIPKCRYIGRHRNNCTVLPSLSHISRFDSILLVIRCVYDLLLIGFFFHFLLSQNEVLFQIHSHIYCVAPG